MNQSINTDSKNSKEPQQKYRLGTVSIKILGDLNRFYGHPTSPSASVIWQNPFSLHFAFLCYPNLCMTCTSIRVTQNDLRYVFSMRHLYNTIKVAHSNSSTPVICAIEMLTWYISFAAETSVTFKFLIQDVSFAPCFNFFFQSCLAITITSHG